MNTSEPDSDTARLVKHSGRAVHLLSAWYRAKRLTFTDDEAQLMTQTHAHLRDAWGIELEEARVRE